MRTKRLIQLFVLAAATAGASGAGESAASVFSTNGYWGKNTVGMSASNVSFPSGSSYRGAIAETFLRFNDNPANFRLTISFGDNYVSRANYQSEIWFTNDWIWGNSALAVEVSRYKVGTGQIIASDIIFRSGMNWTSSRTATNLRCYRGSRNPFRTVLMHELCHTAGLGHENDIYTVLGDAAAYCYRVRNAAHEYVGEDASHGLVHIYGRSHSYVEDLSATHFKWTGRNGEYSDHGRTQIFRTNGSQPNWDWSEGLRRYRVNRRTAYDIEFTFENNGETTKHNVPIGFYLSNNDYITTADRLIAAKTVSLARNTPYTTTYRITLPWSNIELDRDYYLGVIVDRHDSINEINEANNSAFHIVRFVQ